jgi:hypothetical protein
MTQTVPEKETKAQKAERFKRPLLKFATCIQIG